MNVKRMRLTRKSDAKKVMAYFFHRWKGRLEDVSVMDLKHRPVRVARIVRKRIPEKRLERLVKIAKKAKLVDPKVQLFLERRVIPVLDMALPGGEPIPEESSERVKKQAATQEALFRRYVLRLGGPMGSMDMKNVPPEEELARLIYKHISERKLRAFYRQATDHLGGLLRLGEDELMETGQWKSVAYIKWVRDVYSQAVEMFDMAARGIDPLVSEEDKRDTYVFDALGIPNIEAPLGDDITDFAETFSKKRRVFRDQVKELAKVNMLNHYLGKYVKASKRGRKYVKIVAKQKTGLPEEVVEVVFGEENADAYFLSTSRLAARISEAIRVSNPRKYIPGGMNLTVEGVKKYFYTCYTSDYGVDLDPTGLANVKVKKAISKGLSKLASTKDLQLKMDELRKMVEQWEKGGVGQDDSDPAMYLFHYLQHTKRIYTVAVMLSRGEDQDTKQETTSKAPPTTSGGRGEGDPRNKALTPPSDEYFIRVIRDKDPTQWALENGGHPEMLRTLEEMVDFIDKSEGGMSTIKTEVLMSYQIVNRLVSQGRLSTKEAKRIRTTIKQAMSGEPWEAIHIVRDVLALAKKAKGRAVGSKPSLPVDVRVSNGLSPSMQKKCYVIWDQVREIIETSNVPNASRVLTGVMRFRKPRKGVKHRTLGTYRFYKDDINIKALERESPRLVATVIHELGHRYHYACIKPSVWAQWLVYTAMKNAPRKPWVGKRVVTGGNVPFITGSRLLGKMATRHHGVITDIFRENGVLMVRVKDDFGETTRSWRRLQQVRKSVAAGFPSRYARQDPEEHFAETWASYHLKHLGVDLRDEFRHIVIDGKDAGQLKMASKKRRFLFSEEGRDSSFIEDDEHYEEPEEDDIVQVMDVMDALAERDVIFESIKVTPDRFILHGLGSKYDPKVQITVDLLFPTYQAVRVGRSTVELRPAQ